MPVAGGPFIQKTGILLEVDSADKTSYSGTGTTWINQVRPGTNNGTLNNISFDSADAKGALVFTGSNTFVDFGNLGPSLTSSFSFQVAFEPAATASGQPYTILSYASASSTSSITFKLDYTSSNQTVVLTTFAGTGSQNIVYSLSASAASGSWNIVHGTFGSTVAVLYVNGLGQAYTGTTGSVVGYNTANRLYAGLNFGSTSGYFTGSVGNIMVNNADLDGLNVNRNYNAIASRFSLPIRRPSITDGDVFNFVEATGITNQTQIQAINSLVLGLKSNNLWNKMVAIYPFVGGTATTHKFNLKNPQDTDAAYRIIWTGVVIHDSTGVEFIGGFGDTRFAPLTALTSALQSNHLALYNNKVYLSGSNTWGLITAGNTQNGGSGMGISIAPSFFSATSYFNAYNTSVTNIGTGTFPDSMKGLFVATRTDTNQSGYYQRGGRTLNNSDTSSPSASPRNTTVWLGGESGFGWGPENGAAAFASLGTGLTQTDVDNYYTVVQAYQVALGRQA
jgi:hypothetical protein